MPHADGLPAMVWRMNLNGLAFLPFPCRPRGTSSRSLSAWHATAQLVPLVRSHVSLTFGRPCSAVRLQACPLPAKPRLPATPGRPYVSTARTRVPSQLRRPTATFAAPATCASGTVPALAKSQTAAAGPCLTPAIPAVSTPFHCSAASERLRWLALPFRCVPTLELPETGRRMRPMSCLMRMS